MNASNTFKNQFLAHLFQNQPLEKIGDTAGLLPSTNAGNFYLRLCTDAVAVDAGTLGTECAYTGYVAGGVAVPRTIAAWTLEDNEITPAAAVLFGACTAGSETVSYVEVWKNNSSQNIDDRVAWLQLDSDLAVESGITPYFPTESLWFVFN